MRDLIIYTEDDAEFEEMPPEIISPRKNPRKKLPFDQFKGLRVKVALVRDPDYSPRAAPKIGTPADVVAFMRDAENDVTEGMWVVALNNQHRVLGIYEAHRGTVASVEVHPADVLRAVLVVGTNRFILVHNHPSGEAEPSASDDALTRRVAQAAKVVGMVLLDHIVLGFSEHFAYSERRPSALEG